MDCNLMKRLGGTVGGVLLIGFGSVLIGNGWRIIEDAQTGEYYFRPLNNDIAGGIFLLALGIVLAIVSLLSKMNMQEGHDGKG